MAAAHNAIRYRGKLNNFVLWKWTRCKFNHSPLCASLAGTIHYFPSLAAAAWHINLRLYVWPIPNRTGTEAWQWWLEATSERGNPFRGRSNQHNLNLWPRRSPIGSDTGHQRTFLELGLSCTLNLHTSRSHVWYQAWFDDLNTSKSLNYA